MKTDIEIAESKKLKHIEEIANSIGIGKENLYCYGNNIAKVTGCHGDKNGKVVLVTAINPTPMGEGKTTIAIGLSDGLSKIGKKSALALREPSLGPVFGIKGGAAGGGYAQIAPMAEINLHFTGDIHAITAANNLLASMIDNSIFQGNPHNIDKDRIVFKRALDINDRALREISVNGGTKAKPILHDDSFAITAASEVMAIFCMATDLMDLKERLGNILVAFTYDDTPVFAKDIGAESAMAILLKDALNPNLVQTLEGTPAFVHGGPFANVAHGCNSAIATKLARTYADIVVTEAGFGADLGAEKFIDIKCRMADIKPDALVVVASIRALKFNGGADRAELAKENVEALKNGSKNLVAHIENLKKSGIPIVVAINRFFDDSDEELETLRNICLEHGAEFSQCECFANGGDGAVDLAEKVVKATEKESKLNFYYNLEDDFKTKVGKLSKSIYGASEVEFLPKVDERIKLYGDMLNNLPICVAKTQYSFSDNPTLLGRPKDFKFTISDIELRNGAGFVVAMSGDMLLMFGLSKVPNAVNMEIDEKGNIKGLY